MSLIQLPVLDVRYVVLAVAAAAWAGVIHNRRSRVLFFDRDQVSLTTPTGVCDIIVARCLE